MYKQLNRFEPSPNHEILTTLTFHGASLCWFWEKGWSLQNCGTESIWMGVTLRIPDFHRQSWQSAYELGMRLAPEWNVVHLNPEGVTAVQLLPLEPGESCPVLCLSRITGEEPLPIELQGLALPSAGLTREAAACLLLPAGGVR